VNRTLLSGFALCFVVGCASESDGAKIEALERRLVVQEEANKKLAAQQDEMAKTLDSLKTEFDMRELFRKSEGMAWLRPSDSGYSVVGFDLGKLTIAIKDVQPFANGSKVTFRVGNPLASDINGFKASLRWGSVDDKGLPIPGEAKTKDVQFAETLKGGEWTTVSTILDGILPDKLGYVTVNSATHSGIAM